MFRKIILIFLSFIIVFDYAYAQAKPSQPPRGAVIGTLEPFKKEDRVLILAPHPDDESIACAGIIQQAIKAGADTNIVYLTNGEHNEFAFIVYKKGLVLSQKEFIRMGELRKKEAVAAAKLLGLKESDILFLGYPDFGTFAIFKDYWHSDRPFRDILTRISNVPYKGSLSYKAPYKAESILSDLERVLRLYRPTKIFVSHPADVNVDHKALYLFLEVALANLSWEFPQRPKIYPYLIHVIGWPSPRHYHPELTLTPPREFMNTPLYWSEYKLSPQQLEKKYQAILCHRSQTASSAFYLLAFARKNELFSSYPAIKLIMPVQGATKDKISSFREKLSLYLSLFHADAEEADAVLGNTLDTGGKNKISYNIEGNDLVIRIRKTKETADRRVISTIYLFGYSYEKEFSTMPKISILTKYTNFKVFDAKKLIEPEGMNIDLSRENLILKVPLNLLGEPDFILASVRAYTGALPMDTLGFCKIQVTRRK